LKRILRLNRLRLRGPSDGKDEFLLAAIAQNLPKLAKLAGGPAMGLDRSSLAQKSGAPTGPQPTLA
jgi:hypothetical protein